VHHLIHDCRWKPIGAVLVVALMCAWSYADAPHKKSATIHDPFLSIDSWQDPVKLPSRPQQAQAIDVNAIPSVPTDSSIGGPTTNSIISANPAPEATYPVPSISQNMLSPDGYCDSDGNIRLHEGGSPDDWSWGCGGSPYRTGPGFCDNWKVGCRWESSFEGSVVFREGTNIGALVGATNTTSQGALQSNPTIMDDFDHAIGGRVSFLGYMPRWSNYNVQAVYEGWEDWTASIVYPQIGTTPPAPTGGFEQRALYYRSNLHSGELNVVRLCHPVWRPYFGVRYVRFDDNIRDTIDQEGGPFPPAASPPIVVNVVDRLNLFDLENQMIGFQVGLRRDIWRIGRMFSVEGFANTGVYHNMIKRTQVTLVSTNQMTGDDSGTNGDQSSTSTFDVYNRQVTDLTEISYLSEGSVSVVCRLNRCCALTGGYQAMWIQHLHLADDAFLGTGVETRGLFYHGWHAGLEYRR
jgi:hypothetical protein